MRRALALIISGLLLGLLVAPITSADCHRIKFRCEEDLIDLPSRDITEYQEPKGSTSFETDNVTGNAAADTDNTDRNGDGVHETSPGGTGTISIRVASKSDAPRAVILYIHEPHGAELLGDPWINATVGPSGSTFDFRYQVNGGERWDHVHFDFDVIVDQGSAGEETASDFVSVEVRPSVSTSLLHVWWVVLIVALAAGAAAFGIGHTVGKKH